MDKGEKQNEEVTPEVVRSMDGVQRLYGHVEISEDLEGLEKYLETGAELGALKRQLTNQNRPDSQRPNSDLSRRRK